MEGREPEFRIMSKGIGEKYLNEHKDEILKTDSIICAGGREKVKKGDKCTLEQAKEYFAHDLKRFESSVNNLVKVPLTQNQFDALVSLTYNIGSGNFASSTLLKKLNAKDYQGAADQFPRWNKAKGKVLNGLTRRRAAERALFLKK